MKMKKATRFKYWCTFLVHFIAYSSSQHISLIDISTSQGSILQCNVQCVGNPQCTAFTLQRMDGVSWRSNSNICKLNRFKTPNDSEDAISIPDKNDVIMIMKRKNSNIFQSNAIEYSRFISSSDEFSTGVPLESKGPTNTELSTKETTSTTGAETKAETLPSIETSRPLQSTGVLQTLPIESTTIPSTNLPTTTLITTTDHPTTQTLPIESTTIPSTNLPTTTSITTTDPPTTQTLPIESTTMSLTKLPTTTLITTTDHPTTQTLVFQDNFKFTAMDDLGNDKYIFYWTDFPSLMKPKHKPRFSVVNKNNLKINLQEDDISNVFESFTSNDLYAAFTVDGVSYFLVTGAFGKSSWLKYRIVFGNQGLISKGVKVDGTISNPAANLEPMPRCATLIGNDTILFKGESKSGASQGICFHKSLIGGTQITKPPPNKECVEILKIINTDPEASKATSALGNDKSTLRLLLDQTKIHQL